MDEFSGRKDLLRARLRAVSREESNRSWWRRHVPFSLTLLGAYALVFTFGLALPRVLAEHSTTCWAMGGTWYTGDADQNACSFWTPQEELADAS